MTTHREYYTCHTRIRVLIIRESWSGPFHTYTNNTGILDITENVTDYRQDDSITRPWSRLEFGLALQAGIRNVKTPAVHDWVVVKSEGVLSEDDPTMRAIFFGRVAEVTAPINVSEEGITDSYSLRIVCSGWLETLSNNQVITGFLAEGSVGTFFGGQSLGSAGGVPAQDRNWDDFRDAILGLVDAENPKALGSAFSKLFTSLALIRLPPSISGIHGQWPTGEPEGSPLGLQIPVVYDEESAAKYAPNLTVDPVPGWSVQGLQSIMPHGETSLDIITGTFQGDVNMVEMYATFEPFGNGTIASERQVEARSLSTQTLNDFWAEDPQSQLGFSKFRTSPFAEKKKSVSDAKIQKPKPNRPASELADFLGINPVLVYRMRPYRAATLEEYQQYLQNEGLLMNSRGKSFPISESLFPGVTWNRKKDGAIVHGFSVSSSEIGDASINRSHADHINSISIGLPGQPDSAVQWLSSVGLPLHFTQFIKQNGLRHFSPRWPFFPPMNEDLLTELFTIALLACQFAALGDRFFRGTLTLTRFDPRFRPGMTVEADLSAFPAQADLGTLFTAYVDTVSHRISVDNDGVISASTVLGVSRGLFTERSRWRPVLTTSRVEIAKTN